MNRIRFNLIVVAVVTAVASTTCAQYNSTLPAKEANPSPNETPPPSVGNPQATSPDLEDKEFTGRLLKNDGEIGYNETLSFKDGQLYSEHFEKLGFDSAPYTATQTGGITTFQASDTNNNGEKMEWRGSVENGRLAASVTYMDKNGQAIDYRFK